MASDDKKYDADDRPGVKLCPFLPEGNDSAFPFELSIHAAWMLEMGIEAYARQIEAMHGSGEDASYCRLMTLTAIEQAGKLREWAVQFAPDYLEGTIQDLDRLLDELTAQRDRFAEQASREAGGGGKAINLDELFRVSEGEEGDTL